MAKLNAGLYVDVKTLEGKFISHASIQADGTVKAFERNAFSCLFLLVGRKHELEIVRFKDARLNNGTSDKFTINTDRVRVTYWYLQA